MKISEYEMIYMIHQNDEAAFRMLIKEYNESVHFIIFRYQKNKNRAWSIDDYLQLAMIKLMDAVHTYQEDREASFASYYLEIFRRAMIDLFRKSISNKGIYEKSGYTLDLHVSDLELKYLDSIAAPSPPVYHDEEFDSMKESLNEIEVQIIDLRALGYTYAQISAQLNIKVKKVDNTLHKVKSQKRKR